MIRLLSLLFSFLCLSIEAAGPVTHAYLTRKFFISHPQYSPSAQQEFMRGTLFPDIRYLGHVSRTKTHFEEVTINDILEEPSPFIAGMKFHSWVDITRSHYVNAVRIGSALSTTIDPKLSYTYLKLLEDQLVYEKEGWDDCCGYLLEISPEELAYGMDKETIMRWHGMLALFFKSSPSTVLTLVSYFGSGKEAHITRSEAVKWTALLPEDLKNPLFRDYVDALLADLEHKL